MYSYKDYRLQIIKECDNPSCIITNILLEKEDLGENNKTLRKYYFCFVLVMFVSHLFKELKILTK